MVSLTSLILPILLSAVFVFIASSILHMVLPIHRNDFKKIPGEDGVLESMRTQSVAPGSYMFPCPASMKEMASPEMIEKYTRGPVGFMTVIPSGPPAMGKNLVQWFLFCVLVSLFVAYVAAVGLSAGTDYMVVFRVTGTAAILGYVVGGFPESIWKGQPWAITLKFAIDGVIYGLLTAGVFGWLWPEAA